MNETDIRKYAALMQELDLTGLELTEGDRVVRLERSAPTARSASAPAPEVATPIPKDGEGYFAIRSPIVGLFYAAPAENAEPYVSPGDRVKKGQTLCIVEAMKLMNEITAEEDGEVAEICVTNGQMVEYGTVLFRFRRQ